MSEDAAIRDHPVEARPGAETSGAEPLRRMAELSPQIAGFVPKSRKRYDPALNAIRSPWPGAPYASEDWRELPPGLQVSAPAPLLIFEHLVVPRMEPQAATAADVLSDWAAATDPGELKAFGRAFGTFTRATSFANHILRNRNSVRFSIGCRQLLAHFPEIPRDGAGVQAGLLRAGYLGGHIPFRLFPSLVWLDRVKIAEHDTWRVFRQPVTSQGYPIGVCQTYSVDPATEAKWISA